MLAVQHLGWPLMLFGEFEGEPESSVAVQRTNGRWHNAIGWES